MKLSSIAVTFLLALVTGTSTATEESNLRRSLNSGNGNGNGNGNGVGNNPGLQEVDEESEYDSVEPQSLEDSRAEDVALIASLNGWGVEETESHMALQDSFKTLVAMVKDDNRFLESSMAKYPGAPLKLAFKNGVPPYFEDDIAEFEVANNVTIERVSSKFSRKDQDNRAKTIKNKLRAKGFGDLTMAIIGEGLKISAQKPVDDESVKPTPPGRGGIPPGQVDEVAAEILGLNAGDEELYGLQLDIYEAGTELGNLEHTRGGRRIYDSNTGSSCTTAFSVRQKSTGTTGILSAGHCGSIMNRYDAEDSGLHNSPESDYPLFHQATYTGEYGDYAWYTTNHWELPYYWASPSSLRRVTGWDNFPSVDEQVCNYSRMQGRRTCSRIYSYGVYVDFVDFPPMYNHVAVDSHITVGGDSGGPWSWNTDAYGVHSGVTTIDGISRSIYSEMYFLDFVFGGDIELLCDGTCTVKHN